MTHAKPEMGFFDMPFYLHLFGDEELSESQTQTANESQVSTTTTAKPAASEQTTAKATIKHPAESEDAYRLRVELEEAKADAKSAKDRIAELNAENTKRRKNAEILEARLNTADKRVIRAEAIEVLQAEGVINKRIVDLFLADMGDKAKIDPNTGEAIGIRDNLTAWKESNKDFFRAQQEADQTETAIETHTEAKKNATSTGASTGGAAAGNKNTGGLPDLRGLDAKGRKDALDAYKRSQRGAR